MFFVTKINYSFFEKYSKWIFSINIFSLIFVLIYAEVLNGATGWIDLPGLPSIQPSEFLKVGLIIFLAAFFKKYY
jgi:cell division protein FtsW (lipid II flippase)